MHKNAIKKVGWVKIRAFLAKKGWDFFPQKGGIFGNGRGIFDQNHLAALGSIQ